MKFINYIQSWNLSYFLNLQINYFQIETTIKNVTKEFSKVSVITSEDFIYIYKGSILSSCIVVMFDTNSKIDKDSLTQTKYD